MKRFLEGFSVGVVIVLVAISVCGAILGTLLLSSWLTTEYGWVAGFGFLFGVIVLAAGLICGFSKLRW